MSVLSKLNRPISMLNQSREYVTTSRLLTEAEIDLLRKEIASFITKTKIDWTSPKTYLQSFIAFATFYYTSGNIRTGLIASVIVFVLWRILPFLIKGDSALMKKDIEWGTVSIKSGPLTVTTDHINNTYMKRIYMDDVIVDGIYSKDGVLKYPELADGQRVEVTYSPNAHYIFSVKNL